MDDSLLSRCLLAALAGGLVGILGAVALISFGGGGL
jgi:hypothetical protein